MSWDLAIWSQADRTVKNATQIYERLCDDETLMVQPRRSASHDIQSFLGQLSERFPPMESFSDDDMEFCVCMAEFDPSDVAVILCIAYSKIDEVFPVVSALAFQNGLVCFNPQGGTIRLPPPEVC